LVESVAVSTQLEPHKVDAAPEQPLTQVNVPPEPEHFGVPPEQILPHAPQFEDWEIDVSHPWSGSATQ
jgi:hypothetical protein